MIRYIIDVPDVFSRKAEFALRILLEGEGVVAARAESIRGADLLYSAQVPVGSKAGSVWIRHHAADWDDPTTRIFTSDGVLTAGDVGHEQSSDILFATYFLIAGVAETDQPRNEMGVPVGRGSRLWTKGVLRQPAVAGLARELRWRLDKGVRAQNRTLQTIARWPAGHMYAIVLTHDVDRPLSRPPAAHYRARIRRDWKRRNVGAALRGVAGFVRNVALVGDSGRAPENDRQFGFDGWMREAESLGIRSAFYVAVRGSADDVSYRQDVYYDAAHPAIVDAMRRAVDRGFEVGLHASISCRDREELFGDERDRLSSLLDGYRIRGLRHHYWALDADMPEATLAAHRRAGFDYDSSLGMNDVAGFRRGIPWPFRPLDRRDENELDIVQIPPTMMDASVFHYGESGGAEAANELDAHIDEVKKAGGCVVLNWHLAQIDPRRMNGAGPALSNRCVTGETPQTQSGGPPRRRSSTGGTNGERPFFRIWASR